MAAPNSADHVSGPNRKLSDVDGVYAWIIVMASFCAHLLIYGVNYSSGVFYEIFRDIFEASSSMVSLIATLSTAFTFGFSPVPGVLMNKYGQRLMAIIGGLVAGLGLILSAYAPNVHCMAFTFGVVTGVGFGTAYLAVLSIIPLYFTKHVSLAYGLAVSGAGLGTIIYPPIMTFLVQLFGARGALLVIGGATLNLCVCGALMRPPTTESARSCSRTSQKSRNSADSQQPSEARQKSARLALMDLHIFKNAAYVQLCTNSFFVLFGMSIFYVHLAPYSMTNDANKRAAATLISIVGISNFVGRPSFGILGKLRCGSLPLYTASLSLCSVVIGLVPFVSGFIHLAVLSAAFGFLIGSTGPLVPQIITDFLSVDLLPSAYGYLLVFEAGGTLLGPPAAGLLLDFLHQYPPCFYLSAVTIGISSIILIFVYFNRRQTPVVLVAELNGDGLPE